MFSVCDITLSEPSDRLGDQLHLLLRHDAFESLIYFPGCTGFDYKEAFSPLENQKALVKLHCDF